MEKNSNMTGQDFNTTEMEIFEISYQLKEKHKPLKERLKSLSKQLSIAWESGHKLSIMNEMKLIEDEIKSDEMKLKRLNELLEQQKSEYRKNIYKKQTIQYLKKANSYNSSQINVSNLEPIYNNDFDLKNLERVIELISSDDFLYLVKQLQDNPHLKPIKLSPNFFVLYSIWLKLDLVEAEIKQCLSLIQ